MFTKPILYCFISILLLIPASVYTQNSDEIFPEEEASKPFLRLGIDPTRFFLTFLQPADRGGIDISLDTKLWKKVYPVIEGGYMFAERIEPNYHHRTDGFYGRIGVDYNLQNPKDPEDKDMFFVGFRMASSRFEQGATNVYYENIFGNVTTSVGPERLSAYWTELTFGVKAEVFRNFFVGWTARMKYQFRLKDTLMTPYVIPGYGRLSRESNITADINIYLSYAFSL